MNRPAYSLIVPTYNRGEIFQACIRAAIAAVGETQGELIVVNDYKAASPTLPSYPPFVKLLHNPKQGVASARNYGAQAATADLLIFMDDDMIISADNIRQTIRNHNLYPNTVFNPNWVYPPSLQEHLKTTKFGRYLLYIHYDSLKGWRKKDTWSDTEIFDAHTGASYFLSIPKHMFTLLNGYDERFPYAGAEDYEFMKRLHEAGGKIYIDPTITVFHNEADRVDMLPWLERKERAAITRKVAGDIGYSDHMIYYNTTKRIVFDALLHTLPVLKILYAIIPNHPFFDKLSRKVIGLLLSLYLYRGFRDATVAV